MGCPPAPAAVRGGEWAQRMACKAWKQVNYQW